MLIQRALPRKLFAALCARFALIHSLPTLVDSLDVLRQVAAPTEHLGTQRALDRLGHGGLLVVVDGANVVVEVRQRGADSTAELAPDDPIAGGDRVGGRRGRHGRT